MKKMNLLWLFILPLQLLSSLELTRVILSSNDDPKYIEFWPIVGQLWKKMGLTPTLILIADDECIVDTSFGDVIRMRPLPDVPQSLQAQVVRLLAPVLFPDEGCIISDIDMLPISRSYFVENARHAPSDGFIVYRNRPDGYEATRWPMCYVAAPGSIFGSIFGVSRLEDFPSRISEWASLGLGWNTDELIMYVTVTQWEKEKKGRVYRLNHVVEARLDRGSWRDTVQPSEICTHIDCHAPRPYSAYKESIDLIAEAVIHQLEQENPGP